MPNVLTKVKHISRSGFVYFSILLALSPVSLCPVKTGDPWLKVALSGFAQGTTWHITYYAGDSVVLKKEVDSILLVIDSSLSIYKAYSKIVAFNNSTKEL